MELFLSSPVSTDNSWMWKTNKEEPTAVSVISTVDIHRFTWVTRRKRRATQWWHNKRWSKQNRRQWGWKSTAWKGRQNDFDWKVVCGENVCYHQQVGMDSFHGTMVSKSELMRSSFSISGLIRSASKELKRIRRANYSYGFYSSVVLVGIFIHVYLLLLLVTV